MNEQKILDALDESNNLLDEVKTLLKKEKPIVIHVPEQKPPDIHNHIEPQSTETKIEPKIEVVFPEQPRPLYYNIEITNRDNAGRWKLAKLTPVYE